MRDKLTEILASSASADAVDWLQSTIAEQSANFQQRPFYYAFSGVSRRFDKRALVTATPDQSAELNQQKPGFTIEGWDEFRLARVILLLTLAEHDKPVFIETIQALLNTADLREQMAIYSAYPLLPHPEELVESAVDGLRSNIVDIFDSISLGNPFPTENFSDEAWNQMVLKAIFITRPLYRIRGIESRSNAALAEAISDLAHERWAAGRKITPEAWRSCSCHLTDRIIGDLQRMAESDDPNDRCAAALVIAHDDSGKLDHLRASAKSQIDDITSGSLTWNTLGRSMEDQLVRKSLT
tara:strand:- start:1817 stop:2707 length:891 start_codon:yes stop_codon:yes gene_type:complete